MRIPRKPLLLALTNGPFGRCLVMGSFFCAGLRSHLHAASKGSPGVINYYYFTRRRLEQIRYS